MSNRAGGVLRPGTGRARPDFPTLFHTECGRSGKTRTTDYLFVYNRQAAMDMKRSRAMGPGSASHEDTSEAYEKITRFDVSQLAYLAAKLDAMSEAASTVLHEAQDSGGRVICRF
jgi:hypothetical protein